MASATQPASSKGTALNPAGAIGTPPQDSSRIPVAAFNYFQTQDATPGGTNLVSPLTLSSTAVTTLVVPTNAVKVTLIGGAAFQVSEVAGTTSLSQYATIPANTPITLDVARLQYVYLIAPTGTPAVSFIFSTL
jgi:hypothetical protein